MGFDLTASSDINEKYKDGTDVGYSSWLHAFYDDPNLDTYIKLLDLERDGEGWYTTLSKVQRAKDAMQLNDFEIMEVNISVQNGKHSSEWTDKEYHYQKMLTFIDTLIKNTVSNDTKIYINYDQTDNKSIVLIIWKITQETVKQNDIRFNTKNIFNHFRYVPARMLLNRRYNLV